MELRCYDKNCNELLYRDQALAHHSVENGRQIYTCPKCGKKNEMRRVSTVDGAQDKITNIVERRR